MYGIPLKVACSLGSARFLKTVKCRHKNGYLVVKIFIKPDPGVSLRKYNKRLKRTCIESHLTRVSNCYPQTSERPWPTYPMFTHIKLSWRRTRLAT